MDKKINELTIDEYNALNQDIMDKWLVASTRVFNEAVRYSEIIIIIGYAGVFNILFLTYKNLPKEQVMEVSFCLIVSILIFVVYEIVKMLYLATDIAKSADKFLDAKATNNWGQYNKDRITDEERSDIWKRKFYWFWLLTFIPTVFFGLGSATILGRAIAKVIF